MNRLPEHLFDFAREEDRANAPWNGNLRVSGTMRTITTALPLPDGSIQASAGRGRLKFELDEADDIYSLRFYLGGHYRYEANGAIICDAPQLLLSPGTHLKGLTEDPAKLFVDLRRQAVERALGNGPAPDVGLRSFDSASSARLRSVALAAARQAEQIAPELRAKFLRNFQNLAACALAALLREIDPEPRRPDPMIGRRKVADLREWAALDHGEVITVGDLAARCGLGLRALQKNFLHHFDTTPLVYLRNLRLEKARRLLQDQSAAWNVTGAALEAGFAHFGRFSAVYRERFGEHPSETRQRTLGRS